ncbi:hypothetical protein [Aminobacter aminovorans]|uniref:hypothetical protein n=1 Tax=Aminobacter aminovorans TaxID=83263 RepID=UPI002854FDBE|nr:hypothetical protein [Aminobacter aminovorans]MDR7221694.1 hypothetical protein [Aminobacter aminovorans]
MTRKLAISQKQAEALLRAAQKHRGIIEVETLMGTVRLIPECHVGNRVLAETPSDPPSNEDDVFIDLGPSDPPPFPGKATFVRSYLYERGHRSNHDGSHLAPLRAEAAKEWRRQLLAQELGKREKAALEYLSARKDDKHSLSELKGIGPDTIDRLLAREFVEATFHPKHPERVALVWITKSGMRELTKDKRSQKAAL